MMRDEFQLDNERLDREAASLLIAMLGNAPNYVVIPAPILHWYHRRRSLDMQMYDARFPPIMATEEQASQRQQIKADLDVIEFALQEQLKQRSQ